jgi:23S rRNA (pseudouridine1915-N3)-methyltransferase
MNIDVIAVGKLKEAYLKDAQSEYLKRLSRFCRVNVIEVDEEKTDDQNNPTLDKKVRDKEGERILKALSKKPYTIVLDIKGKALDSIGLSEHIKGLMVDGKSDIAFIIGGSTGLSQDIIKNADFRFSMSNLTFPHQLARIILLEQVYRAFKIMNGEAYHK